MAHVSSGTRMPVVDVDVEAFEVDPYPVLEELRRFHPVAWIPQLEGWLVTERDLVVEMMRDPLTFTVDDPRFSTGRVLGPSMLSLDGAEHARHRRPHAARFRASDLRESLPVGEVAVELIEGLRSRGRAELRLEFAAPLAVRVVSLALGLEDADPMTVRAWYDDIVAAVSLASSGQTAEALRPAGLDPLADHVMKSIENGSGLVTEAARSLEVDEVVANAMVMLFGGIETVEGTIASAFAALLGRPHLWAELCRHSELIPNAVEEALRLHPAVMQVDRFATRRVEMETAVIERGDYVVLSIAAANRDPSLFENPGGFDVHRTNARMHLTFAHGPHACIGMHLARMEAIAAIEVATTLTNLRLTEPVRFEGSVFRKPSSVSVAWEAPSS